MLKRLPLLLAVLLTAMPIMGQTRPATQPAATDSGPVLLLPFTSQVHADGTSLGRSVQQELAADLAGDLKPKVLAPATTQPAADADAALQAARKLHAGYVAFGQVDIAGAQVRLTGQVLGVGSGRHMGTVKVTGPAETLFRLEDVAAGQVLAALPREVLSLRGLIQRDAALRQNLPALSEIDHAYAGTAQANVPLTPQYIAPYPPGPYPPVEYGYPPYSPLPRAYPPRFYSPYTGELEGRGLGFWWFWDGSRVRHRHR